MLILSAGPQSNGMLEIQRVAVSENGLCQGKPGKAVDVCFLGENMRIIYDNP
jgi:hypothetical protein